MLSKITNYKLPITNKIQNSILVLAAVMLLAASVYAEEDLIIQQALAPAGSPENITPPAKYNFKLYILAKGTMKKNTIMPDFGWRVLNAFPLKVREFTYPAPYMDSGAQEFKAAADDILNSIAEPRRKNAVRVADAVFEYINTGITARQANEETAETSHKVYFSALQVFKAGAGNNLEKCRLAVAMLRYFSVPARIVNREGGYEVEYYLQPLAEQGKGAWYLYDFEGKGPGGTEFFVPPDWHPVDARELLREEWESPMFIKLTGQKRSYAGADDAGAQAAFAAITGTAENLTVTVKPVQGIFYVVDELAYELWLPDGTFEAKAEFTLPFNIPDDFKTIKYFIMSDDKNLQVKAKWPQTKNKPMQEGVIYTLPVSFKANNRQ